jgi:hypothetical protein
MKKTVSVLLCVVLICVCPTPAVFASEMTLSIEGIAHLEEENSLLVHCNTNAEPRPEKEHFTARIENSEELAVTDVTAFSDADEGATYVFLVDVSGSLAETHFKAVKDTITLICDGLSEKDNISIFIFGVDTYTRPFVSDPEDIAEQLDYLEAVNADNLGREHTSLYDSVFHTLFIMNNDDDVHDKKMLIIFSDCDKYVFQGADGDDAERKIAESRIPIYTVAVLGKRPTREYVDPRRFSEGLQERPSADSITSTTPNMPGRSGLPPILSGLSKTA